MSTLNEFIETYGNVSFRDMPFCDVDNAVICKLSYMPLENVISSDLSDEPVLFSEASDMMFKFNGCEHPRIGLWIGDDVSKVSKLLGGTVRYGELKIVGCVGVDTAEPTVQFGAQTFLSPDGTVIVTFRGTNDSLFGWKEDLDIYAKKSIPSYKLAVDYLESVAARFDGDIILCGHSKGGNVALYAALNASDSVKDRIKLLYNNDGPGFWDYRFFSTPAYYELLPKYRHFVPDSSMVGMMLAHDDDYTVVRSTKKLGFNQHDLTTWMTDDTQLLTAPGLSKLGRFTDEFMKNTILKIDEEQAQCIEQLVSAVISATGQCTLTGISQNVAKSVKGAVSVWNSTAKPAKQLIKSAFKGTGKVILDAAKAAGAKTAEIIAEKIPV